MPPARQGAPTASGPAFSTLGRTSQTPARRSSPNQETTSDTAPQRGASSVSCTSAVAKSLIPEAEFTLTDRTTPAPRSWCSAVVASPYSPVPGISATARTAWARSLATTAGSRAANRTTSKEKTGTRLPKGARSRSSITT